MLTINQPSILLIFLFFCVPLPGMAQQIDTDSLNDSVQFYKARIDAISDDDDVYRKELEEAFINLGLTYKKLGQHQSAVEVFDRASQISRINNGLINDDQLPILDLIIESNIATNDWEALEKNHIYLYWLARNLYGKSDKFQLLEIMARITRWHLAAFKQKQDPIPFKHLLYANDLVNDAIEIAEEEYSDNQSYLDELENNLNYTIYLISRYLRTPGIDDEILKATVDMNRSADWRERLRR